MLLKILATFEDFNAISDSTQMSLSMSTDITKCVDYERLWFTNSSSDLSYFVLNSRIIKFCSGTVIHKVLLGCKKWTSQKKVTSTLKSAILLDFDRNFEFSFRAIPWLRTGHSHAYFTQ